MKFFHPRAPWGELSNYFPSPIEMDGKTYPTVEHWYQACKATSEEDHELVRRAPTAAQAKRIGNRIDVRPDWDGVKLEIMRVGLCSKFQQNPDLARRLLSTGQRPLHEASPSDRFWGWADGDGEDHFGRLLTEIRINLKG